MQSNFSALFFSICKGFSFTDNAALISLNTFLFKVHMAMPMPGC